MPNGLRRVRRAEKNLMPDDMRKAIGEQILTVAKSVSQAVTK